jgi:hypothetical protein
MADEVNTNQTAYPQPNSRSPESAALAEEQTAATLPPPQERRQPDPALKLSVGRLAAAPSRWSRLLPLSYWLSFSMGSTVLGPTRRTSARRPRLLRHRKPAEPRARPMRSRPTRRTTPESVAPARAFSVRKRRRSAPDNRWQGDWSHSPCQPRPSAHQTSVRSCRPCAPPRHGSRCSSRSHWSR